MFDNNSFTLLVTACNQRGGLYVVQLEHNHYTVKKYLEGTDLRGIAKYGDQYVIASNQSGLMLVDRDFRIVANNGFADKDYHTVLVHEGRVYAVETAINAVGIYELPSLKRVGEIRLDPKDCDVLHINDMAIESDRMLVSMFSPNGEWRKNNNPYTGCIAEYDICTGERLGFRQQGLHRPHNVMITDEGLFFCNSMEYTVCREGEVVFQALGFTRGLEMHGDMMFIGQSTARHLERVEGRTNISLDSGVHIFHRRQRGSRFIPLLGGEVYSVLLDEVVMNDRILLGTEMATGYLVSGFCDAESDEHSSWRWSKGAESVMEVKLEAYRPYNIRINMAPFIVPDSVLSVKLFLNKQPIGHVVMSESSPQDYEFYASGEIVKNRNVLRLVYDYAKTPQEVYGTNDTRALAVRFQEIQFEEL